MTERVLVETRDGIATLTLNRPDKLNALDQELCRSLVDALRAVVANDAVRVVIVTARVGRSAPGPISAPSSITGPSWSPPAATSLS